MGVAERDDSKPRVLVTGATGFVGRALVTRLKEDSTFRVVAFVRDEKRARNLLGEDCELALGDITDPGSLERAAPGCDVVIHLAAWASDTGARRLVHAVNVGGTANVVRASVGAGVRRLIHMSSCAVYGGSPKLDIDEDHPVKLSGQVYHDSKVEAEKQVLHAAESSGLDTLILRPPHIFGPNSTHFTVRPMKMILEDRVFLVDGGTWHFKPVYIENLIDAVILTLSKPTRRNAVYNIADGYVKSWRELFTAYAEILGRHPKMRSLPRAPAYALGYALQWACPPFGKKPPFTSRTVRALTSRNSYASHRAQAELGWTPKVSWVGAITAIDSWWKVDGKDLLEDGLEV